MRGDAETAEALAARAEAVLVPPRTNHLVALCQGARMLVLNGAARHAEAFASGERLFAPHEPAHHPHYRARLSFAYGQWLRRQRQSATHGRRFGRRATPSTRSAGRAGASRHAASC